MLNEIKDSLKDFAGNSNLNLAGSHSAKFVKVDNFNRSFDKDLSNFNHESHTAVNDCSAS
ncbi:44147_t:CDS:2 [Gigaspora margarita]|uniref:44147_t:CDS:1 n=1 Tax=Gigaspora margarita TaxID=4874 RepID=A0ABN7V070_GIGMA|nr:44147_t:CDS:2 [Gigaspora margarita]